LQLKFLDDLHPYWVKTAEWGKDADGKGTSGEGSKLENARPYINYLQQFLIDKSIKSVVDIGCGDWQLHRHIDFGSTEYTGFDVFQEIVEKNKKLYSSDRICFYAKDVINNDIPGVDLLIIKDVLQHWPTSQILKLLPKIKSFKYALITNDYDKWNPLRNNSDISDFGGWRTLDLRKEPFGLNGTIVLEYQANMTFKHVLLIDNSSSWGQ
jgi:SAM-dependent methyltransferase